MCIVANVSAFLFHLRDNDGIFLSGILRNLAERVFECPSDDGDPNFFSSIVEFEGIKSGLCSDECNATTNDHAFFNGGTCGVHGIFNPCFLLFHFDFSCRTNVNHSDTTGEFREAFLQFFAVVVRCCVFNLPTDLIDTSLDGFSRAFAFDDGGVIFVDNHAFGTTEVVQGDVFEVDAEVFRDNASVC